MSEKTPAKKLRKESVPMRKASPRDRISDYREVELGYSEEEARAEAERCLQCKDPVCRTGCPANNDIPAMVLAISEGRFDDAFTIVRDHNIFPAFCSRVCPHEDQCEGSCVLGKKFDPVRIGALERFAADRGWQAPSSAGTSTGRTVAVIGSGPAGLACARELAILGHTVTVFEAQPLLGGLLVYGIPGYRLPNDVVEKEVEPLRKLGVRFETGRRLGKDLTNDDLASFDAVFVATGETEPYTMGIPGEELEGVYTALDVLVAANLADAGVKDIKVPPMVGTVAVVGGGNVAMDSLRVARRQGADRVILFYRRGEEQMPATPNELAQVREEGVEILFLTNPVRVLGENDRVTGVECIRMELGDLDRSGRPRPVPIEGSEFTTDVDTVIMAIGQTPAAGVREALPGVEPRGKWGHLDADEETGATANDRVFAGGDVVHGGSTVVKAIIAGRKAAQAIHDRFTT